MRVQFPGVGGNLGECVVCGVSFVTEIILGYKVPMVKIEGFSSKLPVHEKCVVILENNGPEWKTLPDGPLRQEFERADSEVEKEKA